uniref:Uncharacterized protein n=1 Tax=Glossina pallidipes TaxID=7398 RepID=A0A1A9ZIM5_GLOPL
MKSRHRKLVHFIAAAMTVVVLKAVDLSTYYKNLNAGARSTPAFLKDVMLELSERLGLSTMGQCLINTQNHVFFLQFALKLIKWLALGYVILMHPIFLTCSCIQLAKYSQDCLFNAPNEEDGRVMTVEVISKD